jgi:hypothetical protein
MKILTYIQENKRQLVLGLLAFLLFTGLSFTFYDFLHEEPYTPPKKEMSKGKTVIEYKKNNYRALKLQAYDSLIDYKIFTVENIAKIDSLYPDSLCHCGDEFVDSIIKRMN